MGSGSGRRDRRGGARAGPGWPGLTESSFVAFVVLPEGHEPNGDGLQEWPDGRCELRRDASVSSTGQNRDWGWAGVRGRVGQQTFSKHLLCPRHWSRHMPYNVK